MPDFARLRGFLHATSGLDLGPGKRYLAESRLRTVWRDAGFRTLAELVAALDRPERADLRRAVVDAMATNETMFFRDKPVFDALRDTVLPRLIAARERTRRLRIWSAAASTGQEAYSVAMLLADMAPKLAGWRVEIVGTDVSTTAIARARAATYSQFEAQRGLPIRALLNHFRQKDAEWILSNTIRSAVEFRVYNLLDDLSPLGRFDLILCRNLLIYLDMATRKTLLAKLAAALAPDGALCLGASETVLGLSSTLAPDPACFAFVRRVEGTEEACPAPRYGVARSA